LGGTKSADDLVLTNLTSNLVRTNLDDDLVENGRASNFVHTTSKGSAAMRRHG
jgi:hypothetical protein